MSSDGSGEAGAEQIVRRESRAGVVRQRRGPAATGEVLNRRGDFAVCLGRSFSVPPVVVWAWLTDPDKLRIWLGHVTPMSHGPGHFHLAGTMKDAPEFGYAVEQVVPQEQLTVRLFDSEPRATSRGWRFDVKLTATAPGSHLMLEQSIADRVMAPSVAAGCEFYLDRLVRVCHGQPFGDLDHDDYFLSQGPAYRRMFPLPRSDER